MVKVNEQAASCAFFASCYIYPLPFIDIDQCTRFITSCFRGLFTRTAIPLGNRSSTNWAPHHENIHRNNYLQGRRVALPVSCCGTLQCRTVGVTRNHHSYLAATDNLGVLTCPDGKAEVLCYYE